MDPQDDLKQGFSGRADDDHIFESCDYNNIQNASWSDHIAPAKLAPIRTRRLDSHDDEDEAAELGEYDDDDDDDSDSDGSCHGKAMDGPEESAMGGAISGGRRPMEMMKPPAALAVASASASCGSPFSSHESIRRRFLLSISSSNHFHMIDPSILNRLNISAASISSLGYGATSNSTSDQHNAWHMDEHHHHHHPHHLNGCIHNNNNSNDDDDDDDGHINGPSESDENHTDPDRIVKGCTNYINSNMLSTDDIPSKGDHLYIANDQYNTIGKQKIMSVTSPAQISSSSRLGSSSSSRLSRHNYSTADNFFTKLRRFISNCSGHVTDSCPRGARRLLLCCLYCHHGRPKKANGNTKIMRRRRSNNYTVGYSSIFGSFPVGITINSPSAAHNNSINISSSSPGSSRSSVVVSSSSLYNHNYGGGTLVSPRRDHSTQSNYNHSMAAAGSMSSPSPSPRLVRRDSSSNNSSMTIKRGIGRGVMPNIPNTYDYNSNNSKNHRLGWITFRHNHRGMMVMDDNSDPTSPTVTCIGKIRREVGECKKSGDHIADFRYNAKKNGKENIMKISNHVNHDDHLNISYSSTHNNGHEVYLL